MTLLAPTRSTLVVLALLLFGCPDAAQNNVAPSVSVLLPDGGAEFEAGAEIEVTALVQDEDHNAADLLVLAESNIEGPLYFGAPDSAGLFRFSRVFAEGEHVVELKAIDPFDAEGIARVSLTVLPVDPADLDTDGDGLTPNEGDCNDDAAMGGSTVFPGAPELCNSIDDNCDGVVDEGLDTDADLDGHYRSGSCAVPGDDCNDNDALNFPGNSEVCDGADNNCNFVADEGLVFVDYYPDTDGDGAGDSSFVPTLTCDGPPPGFVADRSDCDDTDPAVAPGAAELCDGIDNNCDNGIDEACGACGNGAIEAPEECDDGAMGNSDLLADACRTTCVNAYCGDGVRDLAEACDDGNSDDTDSCHNNCTSNAAPTNCILPPLYTRIIHTEGGVDFRSVKFAPDGSYALVLGYPAYLYKYDVASGSLSLVASASETWNTLEFSADGSFALLGGQTSAPSPVLYKYTEALGLEPVADIVGIGSGKLIDPGRISDFVQEPGTDRFTVLSDNGASGVGQITYINDIEPDWGSGVHTWRYHGALNTSQGSSSIDWGTNLGQPVALAVSRYLELIWYEPLLSSGNVHAEVGPPNHGNLKKVIFNPLDRSQGWVLQWSGQGKVYAWENGLRNGAGEDFGFSGWSMWDFSISYDGLWKIFVGRNGNIWFSDSPFRPVDSARFYNHPIPSFDQPPWSGSSNDYLSEAAFLPGACQGLIVGDAIGGMGLILWFEPS